MTMTEMLLFLLPTLLLLYVPLSCYANFYAQVNEEEDAHVDFPPLIESDDVAFFFSTYDLGNLHWALNNIFHRSDRNPNAPNKIELPQTLVARGGGTHYTTEYKLKHDIAQAKYLVQELKDSDPDISKYFATQVIPVYEKVLHNTPSLSELNSTKGLYAFTKEDYETGIGNVYNKALYMTTADELEPKWKESTLLNKNLDWDDIQRRWFGEERKKVQSDDGSTTSPPPITCEQGLECSEEGSSCSRGTEACCGKIYDSFKCQCLNNGNGKLEYGACHYTDSCMLPSCCRDGPPADKPPPSKETCGHMGSLCDTGIDEDYCCFDLQSGDSYCTKSGGHTSDAKSTDGDKEDDRSKMKEETTAPSIIVIDDILTPQVLDTLRQLLLRNTHCKWGSFLLFAFLLIVCHHLISYANFHSYSFYKGYQTKTPLEFGKYVGAYIDDGLQDPIFLMLAKQLHQRMPRIMKNHHLRYLWAYKYDSEWESGINLHADQAAVNVNMWLSLDDADLEEEGYGGGLVVYTTKPPAHWKFEDYNTNTDFVVKELLEPTLFANVTVKHKANRAVIFDSALFHQTDKYKFKKGYKNGRINLTLLFGEMQKGEDSSDRGTADGSMKEEL